MSTRFALATLICLAGTAPGIAQTTPPNSLWYVVDGDLVELLPNGVPLRNVGLTAAVDAFPSVDGQIWAPIGVGPVRRIDFPGGNPRINSISPPNGRGIAMTLAHAADGTTWIPWQDGTLRQVDASGVELQTLQIQVGAHDAAFDEDGDLWIIHNTTDNVTRVRPSTGSIDTYSLGTIHRLKALRVSPDLRVTTPAQTGYVWISDQENTVWQLDRRDGRVVRTHRLGLTSIRNSLTRPAIDSARRAWVGTQHQLFAIQADGNGVAAAYNFFPFTVTDVAFDATGRLIVHKRDGLETKVDIVDLLSGATLSRTEFGSYTRAHDPAMWHYAAVVDRDSDADGDRISNDLEVRFGTIPWDPQSNVIHLQGFGPQERGMTARVEGNIFRTTPTILFGFARASTPIPIAGFTGQLRLDPASMLEVAIPQRIVSITWPNDPSAVGVELYSQAVFSPQPGTFGQPEFTNVVDMRIWR